MILCYANVLAIWLMGAGSRDEATARVLKEAGYVGGKLTIQVNRPSMSPVSCSKAERFFDKWTNPALKARGLPQAVIHTECGTNICKCANSDVCAHL
jgi:hypothetical protein